MAEKVNGFHNMQRQWEAFLSTMSLGSCTLNVACETAFRTFVVDLNLWRNWTLSVTYHRFTIGLLGFLRRVPKIQGRRSTWRLLKS